MYKTNFENKEKKNKKPVSYKLRNWILDIT